MEQNAAKRPWERNSRRAARVRVAGGVVLLVCLVLFEWLAGRPREERQLAELAARPAREWAEARFLDPVGRLPIPAKPPDQKRFLYISNSHAKTGGFVAEHLHRLLNALEPGRYDVLDLAAPGIFAPEMLQRLAAGLDDDPDAAIVPVAYISFADRMSLTRQSWTARSFFKPGVFGRLPLGFWLRNWDMGLYGDTLFGRFVRLFRYRNELHELWEQPLSSRLAGAADGRAVRFLEVDERRHWEFPEGFDRNLFNWSLYALGRTNHLADMAALTRLCRKNTLPLVACNLPVHWDKEPRPRDPRDAALYRRQLEDVFAAARSYHDWQDDFPKEFSTYDALHPTWFGARLHALALALELNRQGLLWQRFPETEIVRRFQGTDAAVSVEYRTALDGSYPTAPPPTGMRYDLFDPPQARNLFERLTGAEPGSLLAASRVLALSKRILYWRDTPFEDLLATTRERRGTRRCGRRSGGRGNGCRFFKGNWLASRPNGWPITRCPMLRAWFPPGPAWRKRLRNLY